MANLAADPVYIEAWDFNSDGMINSADQFYMYSRLGAVTSQNGHLDLNADGRIDPYDVEILGPHLGAIRPPEPPTQPTPPTPPAPPTQPPPPPPSPSSPDPVSSPNPTPPPSPAPSPNPAPSPDPTPVPVYPAYEALYDVDRDWDIDTDDLNLASTLLGAVGPQNAHLDFDENGRVDAFDIARIAQRTGGKSVDLNGDGQFNAFDFGALVVAMTSTAPDAGADLDGDGNVDDSDLEWLETAYASRLVVTPRAVPLPVETPPDLPVHAPNQTLRIDPALRVGAHYDLSGDIGNIRGLSFNVEETGWGEVLQRYVQPVVNAGIPFIQFHNIWGRDVIGPMRFPVHSQLVDDPELPHLIDSFVPAFRAFHAANPTLETIVYVGSPYTSPTVRALEGDADAWWGLMYETLIPLIEAGFTSIGFDASGSINIWKHPFDLELYELLMNPEARLHDPERHGPLIEALGGDPTDPDNPGRPMTVYFEALPINDRRNGLVDRAEALGHNHMIITYEHYQKQDPDRKDEAGNLTVVHPSFIWNGERFGEMDEVNIILPNSSCRGTVDVGYEQVRAACLQEMRNVLSEQDRNAMADGNIRLLVNPRFLVKLAGNQVNWQAAEGSQAADTVLQAHAQNANLDEFVQELNLAALPMRVDLDPSDYNPEGVEYTITRLPAHGSIELSPYEADVLVYTPDDGFTGTDYLEFKVSDGTHQATGRITLQVD